LNTPKFVSRHTQIDQRLRQTFSHWAEQHVPPVQVRRELMRNVRQEATTQGHHVTRLPSDGFIETVYLGPVITFNHAFSMFYTLHSRVRL
jgi:hypothetical protein